MSIRRLFLAFLAVLLVIPAFTAAWADTAGQNIEVSVEAADVLSISVESDFGLDIAIQGRLSRDRGFWMDVTNTFVDQAWQVTVDANDLQGFYWGDPCDDQGNCTRVDTADVIAKTNLYLKGGFNDWKDESQEPIFVAHEGKLTDSPVLLLMEGTADAFGRFGFDQQPSISLDTPEGAALGDYYTTVTYTIEAQPTTP